MLLRLLPAPTSAQANPPTILFTLPPQSQPYTARSLPLPPNLLAHRSVCLQEDIDCPNVLLGDKASWITGIIDDVTFSLVSQSVTVNFIDGTQTTYPVKSECAEMLHRVCKEVELSFAPVTPQATPMHSRQSSASSIGSSSRPSTSSPSARRSPSSLLLSLLSPLLPTATTAVARIPPARAHRRQARSLLVDTFRRFVLPSLKADLPSAYLPWSVASEITRRMVDFETLRAEVDKILADNNVEKGSKVPLMRYRTYSSGSMDSDDSDSTSVFTPATSRFSVNELPSPQSFLLSIPPAHVLPSHVQSIYASHLQSLTKLASRLHSIKRLGANYEKEESKRLWLESMERERAANKSLRKAWSNGEIKQGPSEPSKRSGLWRSWTAVDQVMEDNKPVHPAMEEADEELSSDDEDDISIAAILPAKSTFAQSISVRVPIEDIFGVENSRPLLARSLPAQLDQISDEEDDDEELPSLCYSSTESLTSGEWDEELRTPSPPLLDDTSDNEDGQSTEKGYKWMTLPNTNIENDVAGESRAKSRLGHRRRAGEMDTQATFHLIQHLYIPPSHQCIIEDTDRTNFRTEGDKDGYIV